MSLLGALVLLLVVVVVLMIWQDLTLPPAVRTGISVFIAIVLVLWLLELVGVIGPFEVHHVHRVIVER